MVKHRRLSDSGYVLAVLLLWSITFRTGSAQQYDFKRYSVAEGMPHTLIGVIYQDRDDYMWFGTLGGGLARFDGSHFETYTRTDGLRDNVVHSVFEDSHENFWVGTDQGGVALLKDDSLRYQFQNSPIDTATVYNVVESPDGRVWFATYGAGLFIYDGDTLKQLTVEDGLSSNYIWDFWFREDGRVWIATHYGLTLYDESEAGENQPFETITDVSLTGGYAVYDFYEDSNGTLWFVTNNGVTRYRAGNFEVMNSLAGVPLGFTYAITEDRHGNMWIGTAESGVFRQFGGDDFYQVTAENGLSSNWIYDLYRDRHGNIWVGTNEDGASLYRGDAFIRFNGPAAVEDWPVLAVYHTGDDRLLVGTDGHGLWEITGGAGDIQARRLGFAGQEVWGIEELDNGHLLLLMGDNRILEFDGRRAVSYNDQIGLLPLPYTIDLFVDTGSRVWVGTDTGAYRAGTGSLQHYTISDGLADNFVWEISELREHIWLATNNGLSIFREDSLQSYTTDQGLAHDIVSTVLADSTGDVWVGTSGGISHLQFSPADTIASVTNFDADDGLPFVDTQLLQFDARGNLWQGTNSGLQMLDVSRYRRTGEMHVMRFPLGDNESGLEFAHKAVDRDSKGVIWFGTTTGLLRYEPQSFTVDSSGPKINISDLEINFQNVIGLDHTGADDSIVHTGHGTGARLDYSQNNLRFHFGALEYKNPESVVYRYRLRGFSEQWSDETDNTSATFTNLAAKDYLFEVQAKNRYGFWGKAATMPITITPPFWTTWWFYILAILLVLGLGYIFIRSRVYYLEKQRLSVLVEEKTEDLQRALGEKEILIKEIHHRVKNNLAVISGLLELQMGKTDNELAEKVLQESQRRVMSISMVHEKLYQNERLSEINFQQYIEELIEIIAYSFSHIEKDIQTEVNVRGDVQLSIDQSIPCGLILNELVSNAFEHAFVGRDKGTIVVDFISEGSEITFIVTDDGVGCKDYEYNGDRESLGITLVETLTMQLEGTLEVNTSGEGTAFIVSFKNNLSKET